MIDYWNITNFRADSDDEGAGGDVDMGINSGAGPGVNATAAAEEMEIERGLVDAEEIIQAEVAEAAEAPAAVAPVVVDDEDAAIPLLSIRPEDDLEFLLFGDDSNLSE